MTLFGKKQALGAAFVSSFVTLAPQEEHSVSVDLSRHFDMTVSGEYSIAVSKRISIDDGREKITPESPPLAVSIIDE